MTNAGVVYILHGPQGAGKDDNAAFLAAVLNGVVISSGDVIRRGETETDRAAQAEQTTGDLITANYFMAGLEPALRAVPLNKPLILAGVARKPEEIQWLLNLLEELGRIIEVVLLLNVRDEVADERIKKRSITAPRNDDDPAIQAERRRVFREVTLVSIERYRQMGLLAEVDANGAPYDVFDQIAFILNVPNVAPVE